MDKVIHNYVTIYFLPGAAGNFISRCVNLLDNTYGWFDKTTGQFPGDLNDKMRMFSYAPVIDFKFGQAKWTEFEGTLMLYPHHPQFQRLFPNNAHLVAPDHPSLLGRGYAQPHDTEYLFYIDPSEAFEWHLLNAYYKHSMPTLEYFSDGEIMRLDPKYTKISLKNIIESKETFIDEIQKICNRINHVLTGDEKSAILELYSQWKLTTLDYKDFNTFKKKIGFFL